MSRNGRDRTRREFVNETLAALGVGATVGLAGCSGDDGSSSSTPDGDDEGVDVEESDGPTDEPDTAESPDVEHVELDYWGQYVLSPTNNNDAIMFDAWSPSQFQNFFGLTPTQISQLGLDDTPAYENVSFSKQQVPETSLHRRETSSYVSGVKIDQLPGGQSVEDVSSSLRESDYEEVGEVGEFRVYSKPAAESVHAVTDDYHAFAANIFEESTKEAMTSQHRAYLEEVLEEKNENNFDLPEEIGLLTEVLGPKDTLTIVNLEGYSNAASDDKMIGAMGGDYQPSYGATSVDLEEGLKYGAWTLEDEDLAQNTYDRLMNDSVRNEWQNLDVDGRVLTAVGPIDMESRIRNSKHLDDDMTCLPQA